MREGLKGSTRLFGVVSLPTTTRVSSSFSLKMLEAKLADAVILKKLLDCESLKQFVASRRVVASANLV